MKKFTKLSLATAVALGSLSSLSADFIDSSTFNGFTRGQFDSVKTGDDKAKDVTKTKYRFELNIKTQVADDAYSFVRLRANTTDSRDASDAKKGTAANKSTLNVRRAYIDFALPGVDSVRVRAGRSYDAVYDADSNSISATADLGAGFVGAGFANQIATGDKGASAMFVYGGLNETAGVSAEFDYITFNPSKNAGLKSDLFAKGIYAGMGATVTGVYAASTPETGDKGSYMGVTASYDVAGWTTTGLFASTDKKAGVANLGYGTAGSGSWSKYNLYLTDVAEDIGLGTLGHMNVVSRAEASTVGASVSGSVAGVAVSAAFASNKAGKAKNTDLAFTASKEVVKNLKAAFKFASATADKANSIDSASGFRVEAKYSF